MKLTNRLNLPQPIVDAVKNDGYDGPKAGNSISVTSLIAPPRKVALTRQFGDQIEEDASDRIWSLMGQLMHGLLERANRSGVAERRLTIQVEGWTVSGGMDLYDANTLEDAALTDYKLTTVYKFKGGKVPEEFEQQLNVYAEILRQNGEPIKRLQLVGILRDWSAAELKQDRKLGKMEYPDQNVVRRDVPLWSSEQAQKFIRERVILHQQARVTLPLCSDEEKWAKPNQWAVMKKGNTKATKLYGSEAEAKAHASENASFYVEFRPGAQTRCENYCSVAEFCSQYQSTLTKPEEVA